MKQIFTLLIMVSGLTVFAQQKTAAKQQPATATKSATTSKSTATSKQQPAAAPAKTTTTTPSSETLNTRNAATSSQTRTAPAAALPYDVNDKYMGRKAEFLNDITLPELPADFPVYEKQWDLKDYNQVVDAYFINHKDILTDHVRQKIESLQH